MDADDSGSHNESTAPIADGDCSMREVDSSEDEAAETASIMSNDGDVSMSSDEGDASTSPVPEHAEPETCKPNSEDAKMAKLKAYWQRFVVPKFGGKVAVGKDAGQEASIEPCPPSPKSSNEVELSFSQQLASLMDSPSSKEPRRQGGNTIPPGRGGFSCLCIPYHYHRESDFSPTASLGSIWTERYSPSLPAKASDAGSEDAMALASSISQDDFDSVTWQTFSP